MFKKKGFTLIELIIVIVLVGIIGAVVGEVALSNWNKIKVETVKSQLNAEAKALVEKVINEIRESTEVKIYKSDGITEISDPSGGEGVILKCKSPSGQEWWFTVLNKNLLKSIDNNFSVNSDVILAKNVEEFKIRIISISQDRTTVLYKVSLRLSNGAQNNKVEVLMDSQIKKYIKP